MNGATAKSERLYQIIKRPLISEKSTLAAENDRQVVFEVLLDANKNEIKAAVEMLFEVEVERVQVMKVKGKVKRTGRSIGRRSDWKKAYVRLASGHDLDFLEMSGA